MSVVCCECSLCFIFSITWHLFYCFQCVEAVVCRRQLCVVEFLFHFSPILCVVDFSSSFSSVFPAMLGLQSGDYGEVRSLLQCLNRSPRLSVGIHWTGPCLESQSIESGAGLQDVVGGLMTFDVWT